MKECSQCSLCFDDAAKFCPNDGAELVDSLLGGRELDGRWQLDRVVRVARTGSVYVATDLESGRHAMVKTFFPTLFATPGAFERLAADAERLRMLEHPNAGRTYAVGRLENGGAYLVSEWIEGQTLRQALGEGAPFTVERATATAAALADALGAAHSLGILHRDVTPERAYLEKNGSAETPRLVDFEAAQWLQGTGGSAITSTGSLVIRLPHYTSPEQCRGDAVDGRSDLYSLGIVLYEMLAGRPPFDAPVPMAVIVKHVTDAPEPLGRVRDGIPPALDDAVLRALAKAPGDRFQSGAEMAATLRAAVIAQASPVAVAAPAQPTQPAPPSPEPQPQRRIPAPPTPLRMRMTIVDASDETHESRVIDGAVHDVGENGMRIQTGTISTGHLNVVRDHTTAFKNRLEIDVDLPDGPIHVSGFAAWYKPAPDGVNWNVGVYIRDMTSADRARYNAYLQQLMNG